MLTQKFVESTRNLDVQAAQTERVGAPLQQDAANASRWAVRGAFARRMRRQRRMERAARRPNSGWSVRAW